MAKDQTPGEEDIDLITEIQQKLGNLLGLMYSCTGAIQVHLSYILLHAWMCHDLVRLGQRLDVCAH